MYMRIAKELKDNWFYPDIHTISEQSISQYTNCKYTKFLKEISIPQQVCLGPYFPLLYFKWILLICLQLFAILTVWLLSSCLVDGLNVVSFTFRDRQLTWTHISQEYYKSLML